ncbi:PhzF family phenazine biosynthesis protein [Streptomyces sulfonofaciens]|uniref:PhzF family phenazine biosynthesis protein n=1 Tax=Streptomyces sulfonofaciens TaxID=68272 RepID=UPI0016772D92|nr:PhzF family phenazine biosynthesis protein [Streptomyces sulfonofaciens]
MFCGPDGRGGEGLGVVRDGSAVPGTAGRQALAARLGRNCTVFVDDPERGAIDLYTPTLRAAFAGHCCVGAAWLLDLPELITPAGVVGARCDGEFTWIEAHPEWAAPTPAVPPGHRQGTLRRYASAAEVDALPAPPPAASAPAAGRGEYAWAWEDERAGRVRARALPGRADGPADDGATGATGATGPTGAGALLLTAELGRALNIRQGRGSQILTAPGPGGQIELGGRVILERPLSAPPHTP